MTTAFFGELLLRLAAPGRELLLQSSRLDTYVGGAEANVAIGLACLGHETRMISRLPDNPLGRAALGELRRHGVDVSGVAVADGRMGLYFLAAGAGPRASSIVYDRDGSSFGRASADDYDWQVLLRGADHLHLSGITPALGEGPAEAALTAAEAASRAGIGVSFDGNYRAQLWERRVADPRPILGELVGRATVFFGNHRDISLLLGRSFSGGSREERREAADAAFAAFPNLKLIASTARIVEDADCHRIAARIDAPGEWAETEEVRVTGIVDRIGTGDAFVAGVLHGLRIGSALQDSARIGLALSCLKHTLPGDASLFGCDDLDAMLAGTSDVRR